MVEAPAVGTVYGVLLNDRATLARHDTRFRAPPYGAPPQAPVLYVKPRNTFADDGAVVRAPAEPGRVRVDATVGAVIGRRASRVRAGEAASHVAGWRIVGDVTLPHDGWYRPAIRSRCRDGFCPMGRSVDAASNAAFDPTNAEIVVSIDGCVAHRRTLATLVRGLPALLEDVTAFMTLDAGDVLLLGAPDGMPEARVGSRVDVGATGLGSLSFVVEAA